MNSKLIVIFIKVELKDQIRKMKYLEGLGIAVNTMLTEREEELQIKENEYDEVFGDV